MTEEQTDLQKLKKQIETVMKSDVRLWDEEGILDQVKLIEFAVAHDETIIDLLYGDESLRQKFFLKIKDTFVFKTNDFQFFMEENKIDNSFTAYKNRIDLTDGKNFIKDTNDVVLNFPYKDCVLEGGQSNEEGSDTYFELKSDEYQQATDKHSEIFYNETIAHDEIDRLLDTKAFIKWKRYNKNGDHEVEKIKRHADGTISENMIIKGNNLLALHSLKKQFASKIKLIYIDPPFNTKTDSFQYNDRFKHSTWLTFMKNRLEIATELLRDDGLIFVHCDDNEQAYLKVLMDNIFGRDNFIATIAIKSSTPSGIKTAHKEKTIIKQKDFLIIFRKNECTINPQYMKTNKWDSHYNHYFNPKKEMKITPLSGILKKSNVQEENYYNIDAKDFKKFYLENAEHIVRHSTYENKTIMEECIKNKGKILKFGDDYYIEKSMLQPLSKSIKKVLLGGYKVGEDIAQLLCDFWSDVDFQNTQNEGDVSLPTGKKPEVLIMRIINIATEEGDIVLDYHMGSGTTCAVAHKMNRQYIGIEQLDYIEEKALWRMNQVLKGDKTGISKIVNWNNGGEFIYCELAKWNEQAKEKIQACKNLKQLEALLNDLCNKYFLHYNVKIKEFKEKIIKEKEFRSLSIERQKEMFSIMLDNNQLYVHYSEMEDSRFKISASDRLLTKEFYEDG